jgi:hypothetical protein
MVSWAHGLLGTWALGDSGSLGSWALGLIGSWALVLVGSLAIAAWGHGLSGSWALGLFYTRALWYSGYWRYSDTILMLLDAEGGEQFSPEHFKVCSLCYFGLPTIF